MPAPDFLEAGKFRLQRGLPYKIAGSDILDDPAASLKVYNATYNDFIKVSAFIKLSNVHFRSNKKTKWSNYHTPQFLQSLVFRLN
jgi:hypothetical protein